MSQFNLNDIFTPPQRFLQYLHSPQGIDPRGGGASGDHIDIMVCCEMEINLGACILHLYVCRSNADGIQGHTEMLYNLLQIAAGHGTEVRSS